ncbi:unnamed protein product [Phytophthora fragariaefolia]|uniref:Unnamed protein product n=1 Tax=Phytophthora fragariaefolia TaxID=1490495 RepID=A0A9W7D4S1_9STRA|nr:unnamed protein product [Phytophthora fragariaefolia]
MRYGDRISRDAPVDFVEGIGGFTMDVIDVWHFAFRSVFNELIEIDACILSGCTSELLMGVDFMKAHGAIMAFHKSEVRYREGDRSVVIPFITYDEESSVRRAAVRMVRKTEFEGRTVMPIEVAVPATDGERGVFVPTRNTGAIMMAARVTTAKNGNAWGHELSCEGVRPLQRLVTAVRNFPRPANAIEVKRFTHLAGYYRRFVKDFGSLMAPLTKLLRKSSEWRWDDEQEAAFEMIKDILTTKPLLVYPDFRLPFRVDTVRLV